MSQAGAREKFKAAFSLEQYKHSYVKSVVLLEEYRCVDVPQKTPDHGGLWREASKVWLSSRSVNIWAPKVTFCYIVKLYVFRRPRPQRVTAGYRYERPK